MKKAQQYSAASKTKIKYYESLYYTVAVLYSAVSKALINSYINYDEFVSMNNLIREYSERK